MGGVVEEEEGEGEYADESEGDDEDDGEIEDEGEGEGQPLTCHQTPPRLRGNATMAALGRPRGVLS